MAKILIVEDTQEHLELYAKTFRRAGFEVFGAHDGGHAMERVRDVRPDIILLDQMMPEVDGITFLTNLRRFPRYKTLPVIIITGLNDKVLRTRASTLGVSDFLQKGSFQMRDLVELVKQKLTTKPAQAGGPSGAAAPSPATGTGAADSNPFGRPSFAAKF